jgi:hypothetical protein
VRVRARGIRAGGGAVYLSGSAPVNLTSGYSALWKRVVAAAEYRRKLAWRVRPRRSVPWDVFAVRYGDLTIEKATLDRLQKAQEQRPPEAASCYAQAACSPNFAEAVAELQYGSDALSLQQIEHIRRLGETQELIAEAFYTRLRFGRIATIAIAAVSLVALPKETVEKYLGIDYATFGGIVFVGTVVALGALALITLWPGRLAARRAEHTRLFKAVLIYLETRARQDAEAASSNSTSTPDEG